MLDGSVQTSTLQTSLYAFQMGVAKPYQPAEPDSYECDHFGDAEPPIMHDISNEPGVIGSASDLLPIDVDAVKATGHQAPDTAT